MRAKAKATTVGSRSTSRPDTFECTRTGSPCGERSVHVMSGRTMRLSDWCVSPSKSSLRPWSKSPTKLAEKREMQAHPALPFCAPNWTDASETRKAGRDWADLWRRFSRTAEMPATPSSLSGIATPMLCASTETTHVDSHDGLALSSSLMSSVCTTRVWSASMSCRRDVRRSCISWT